MAQTVYAVIKPPREHGSAPAFTPDSAREAVRTRERMKEEAFRSAVAKHGGGDERRGLEKLAKVQVKIAADKDQGFNATRALDRLLVGGGYAAPKNQRLDGNGSARGVVPGLSDAERETLSVILALAREKLLGQHSQAEIALDNNREQELSVGDDESEVVDV